MTKNKIMKESIKITIALFVLIVLSVTVGISIYHKLTMKKMSIEMITSCENDFIYPYYFHQRRMVSQCREMGGQPYFDRITGEMESCQIK
jgi:hypothetical protein